MIRIKNILFTLVFCLYVNKIEAQVSIGSFFSGIKQFVAANYSIKDLQTIKRWSDSNHVSNNSKKKIRQLFYRGELKTKEGVNIDFVFFASELATNGNKKCNGTIVISSNKGCKAALLKSTFGYIPKYNLSFDTAKVVSGDVCSCEQVRLHFNNYNTQVNRVLETVDTSIISLLKKEYFDFYFADVNIKTSTWQTDFKTFMQPHSDVLTALVNKNNIKGIFDIIALYNKGYSWSLSEGLWYYNTLHSVLTREQSKIIEAYNGKKGMIFFRPKEDLEKVYKF